MASLRLKPMAWSWPPCRGAQPRRAWGPMWVDWAGREGRSFAPKGPEERAHLSEASPWEGGACGRIGWFPFQELDHCSFDLPHLYGKMSLFTPCAVLNHGTTWQSTRSSHHESFGLPTLDAHPILNEMYCNYILCFCLTGDFETQDFGGFECGFAEVVSLCGLSFIVTARGFQE